MNCLSRPTTTPSADDVLFDAIIMHVSALAKPLVAPTFWESRIPVLVVGPGESLTSGYTAAYAWAGELMSEPWSDQELLLRAFRLLASPARHHAAAPRTSPIVLIADDDVWLRSLLESVLKAHGASCYSAIDGLQTLRCTRELVPNLILLDVDMPLMSGFEVLRSIRLEPGLETVVVVMLTASHRREDIARGAELGADDYIAKPVHPVVLTNRIKRLLRSSCLPAK